MSELSRCVCGCPIQAHKIKGGQCLACACNGYQRDTEYQAPTHPAVEVLDKLEKYLALMESDLGPNKCDLGWYCALERLRSLRAENGV